jgi:uncharacterized membrane protein (DUF4010 family)
VFIRLRLCFTLAVMDLMDVFQPLGIALGLGLLVGLQRERTNARLAGFRTFPLVTLLGALCALLGKEFGGWLVVAGLAGVAVVIAAGNLSAPKDGSVDPGLTTEAAMLVMFLDGAYLVVGHTAAALAIGGGVAVLLHLKPQMHAFAARMGEADVKAVMQFVLVALVILPVTPDRYFGPFSVLNPFRIWLMVVLIVGISLGGYVAYKLFGQRYGILSGGVLGGLISSTATTVSYARRAREMPGMADTAALVVLLASSIVFVRILILLKITAPQFLRVAGPPLMAMLGVSVVVTLMLWWRRRRAAGALPEPENPTELRTALVFALIYAVVVVAIAAAKEYFGPGALYVVAILSGLTDMDAITLSTGQLVSTAKLSAEDGWRVILAASLSNLLFKGGVAAALGGMALFRHLLWPFTVALAAGLAMLLLSPA